MTYTLQGELETRDNVPNFEVDRTSGDFRYIRGSGGLDAEEKGLRVVRVVATAVRRAPHRPGGDRRHERERAAEGWQPQILSPREHGWPHDPGPARVPERERSRGHAGQLPDRRRQPRRPLRGRRDERPGRVPGPRRRPGDATHPPRAQGQDRGRDRPRKGLHGHHPRHQLAEDPVFAESDYRFDLPENRDGSDTPVAVGAVAATDPDGGAVTYAITGGDPDRRFRIRRSRRGSAMSGPGRISRRRPGSMHSRSPPPTTAPWGECGADLRWRPR